MKVARFINVSGRVQGVGFRYFVRREALQLGLCGYVRNLAGGDVEIYVEGDEELIKSFTKELKTGPHYGHVTDLQIEERPCEENFQTFEVHF